jgi:UDP-glucose 4-epimerase
VLGIRYLESGKPSDAFNLGNGNGFSVRKVISAVERITGRTVKCVAAPRRPGDPSALVGGSTKARQILGWTPKLDTLDVIIETAWAWHSTNLKETRARSRETGGADEAIRKNCASARLLR